MNNKIIYAAAHELERQYPQGIEGIIFDCDGVMFDTRDSNIAFYNLILERLSLPSMTPEQEHYVHMSTVAEALECIVPEEKRSGVEEACQSVNYLTEIMPHMIPEEGFFDFVKFLHRKNIRMAVHTNRTNTMEKVLEEFALSEFFSPVMTAGKVRGKPNPEGSHAILDTWNVSAGSIAFIGDSSVDMQTAQNASVPFWAFKNDSLEANLHIRDFAQLYRAMESFLGA